MGRRKARGDSRVDRAENLNTAALVVGLVAAVLMAVFPPRVRQYTAQGAPIIMSTGKPTRKWWGRCQQGFSVAAPLLLGLAFLLQLVALRMK